MADTYRFLPWMRRGLSRGVTGPPTAPGGLPAHTSIAVDLDVSGATASTTVHLNGPGDVTGIDRRTVLRTEPRAGATDFEPSYLACIEFDPPDFPWLFTPAAPAGDRLHPWCVLVVVTKGPGVSLSVRTDSPLPVLTVDDPAAELPDLRDSWGWAHTQVVEEGGATDDVEADPDRNLSRLVCPRRLQPLTRYLACVVPAFDVGAQRGRGLSPSGVVIEPAWDVTVAGPEPVELPVYYFWEFSTAVEDDIEAMARRLHGPDHAPADLGRRRVYAAAGHRGLARPPLPAASRVVTMGGAVRPARSSATPPPVQDQALTDRLAAIVAARDTPELPGPAVRRVARRPSRAGRCTPVDGRAEHHRRPSGGRGPGHRGRAPPPGAVRAGGVGAGRSGARGQRAGAAGPPGRSRARPVAGPSRPGPPPRPAPAAGGAHARRHHHHPRPRRHRGANGGRRARRCQRAWRERVGGLPTAGQRPTPDGEGGHPTDRVGPQPGGARPHRRRCVSGRGQPRPPRRRGQPARRRPAEAHRDDEAGAPGPPRTRRRDDHRRCRPALGPGGPDRPVGHGHPPLLPSGRGARRRQPGHGAAGQAPPGRGDQAPAGARRPGHHEGPVRRGPAGPGPGGQPGHEDGRLRGCRRRRPGPPADQPPRRQDQRGPPGVGHGDRPCRGRRRAHPLRPLPGHRSLPRHGRLVLPVPGPAGRRGGSCPMPTASNRTPPSCCAPTRPSSAPSWSGSTTR